MATSLDWKWSRVLAEGVAVVLSILLAFAIQAWWDDLGEERIREVTVTSELGRSTVKLDVSDSGVRSGRPRHVRRPARMLFPSLDSATRFVRSAQSPR